MIGTGSGADFAQYVAGALSDQKLAQNLGIASLGLNRSASDFRVVPWKFWDTFYGPKQTLGTFRANYNLFSAKEVGSARNLSLPTTLDYVFGNYDVVIYCDLQFGGTADEPANGGVGWDGQYVDQATRILLEATRFTYTISQTTFHDTPLSDVANFQKPSLLDGVELQAAPAPIGVFPPTHEQHHPLAIHFDGPVIWPMAVSLTLPVVVDVPAYWNNVMAAVPTAQQVPIDVTKAPWNIEVQPRFRFLFLGQRANITQ